MVLRKYKKKKTLKRRLFKGGKRKKKTVRKKRKPRKKIRKKHSRGRGLCSSKPKDTDITKYIKHWNDETRKLPSPSFDSPLVPSRSLHTPQNKQVLNNLDAFFTGRLKTV